MPAILVRWFLLSILLPLCIPPLAVADFSGPVVSILDGDTIEVLHNQHPERIRLSGIDSTGLVVRILDGDTIEVLHNRQPERIRLSGIDCPEKGQPYGQKAKQATYPCYSSGA